MRPVWKIAARIGAALGICLAIAACWIGPDAWRRWQRFELLEGLRQAEVRFSVRWTAHPELPPPQNWDELVKAGIVDRRTREVARSLAVSYRPEVLSGSEDRVLFSFRDNSWPAARPAHWDIWSSGKVGLVPDRP